MTWLLELNEDPTPATNAGLTWIVTLLNGQKFYVPVPDYQAERAQPATVGLIETGVWVSETLYAPGHAILSIAIVPKVVQ